MFTYKNKGETSGITSFRSGNHYIKVLFTSGAIYMYTKNSAGYEILRYMQHLARKGFGLNSFIAKNRPPFSRKEGLTDA